MALTNESIQPSGDELSKLTASPITPAVQPASTLSHTAMQFTRGLPKHLDSTENQVVLAETGNHLDNSLVTEDQADQSRQLQEVGDHTSIKLDMETATSTIPLARYRPTQEIPSFRMLHKQVVIPSEDPKPGSLLFPGSSDSNGQWLPTREVFSRPQRELLPDPNEPLWRQMLHYSQIWGTFVMAVDDEKRRAELMQSVTQKMYEAWQFGISHGHCGEPTGHELCCHAGSARTKPQHLKETRKRPVDVGKQPAAFACDSLKHSHFILNRELDKAGITMEEIMHRATSEVFSTGSKLLDDICGRLGRANLEVGDWATVFKNFDPRVHPRNLLMYCLWEVQRCRKFLSQQLQPCLDRSNTLKQQEKWQERIDLHNQRISQHFALALMLNDQHLGDTEAESEAQNSDVEQVRCLVRAARLKPAPVVLPVDEDGLQEGAAVLSTRGQERNLAATAQAVGESAHDQIQSEGVGSGLSIEPKKDAQLNAVQCAKAEEESSTNFNAEPVRSETNTGEVVGAITGGASLLNPEPGDTNIVVQNTRQPSLESEKTTKSNEMSSIASNSDTPSDQFLQSLHEHAEAVETTDNEEVPESETDYTRQMKENYTFKHWQPWVNNTLMRHGFTNLNWPLKKWADIKHILEGLEFSLQDRNKLLREYKAGFEEWKRAMTQRRTTVKQGVVPPQPLQESRGFSFRCYSNTTQHERDRVDDMVNEYLDWILHSRAPRIGYYVAFYDPENSQDKPLAHGVWSMRGQKVVPDAAWFYQGQLAPKGFRENEERYFHPWGYSQPPPKTRAKSTTTSRAAQSANVYTDEEDVVGLQGTGLVRKQLKRKADDRQPLDRGGSERYTGRKKRRGLGDDSDNDADWDPNA